MTDLRSTLQGLDGQHRESVLIVDGDLPLVLLNEGGIRRWKIMEWPVRDAASSVTFGHDTVRREGDFFGFRVAEDRESDSPRCWKTVSQ